MFVRKPDKRKKKLPNHETREVVWTANNATTLVVGVAEVAVKRI